MLSVRLVACSLAVTLALALPPARTAEEPHPLIGQAKASLKDTSNPFTMIVRLQVKDGSSEKFEITFGKAIGPTRKEKGCRAYELNRDAKTPNQYIVYERWQSLAALESHLKTPHITTLLMELGDLLAGPPEFQFYVPAGE